MCVHATLTWQPGGIYNASIPFILVACKCDFPSTHRHVDPAGVEKRAKALIGDITAFQTSKAQPDSQKRCVAVLLRAIVSMRNRKCASYFLKRIIDLLKISRGVGLDVFFITGMHVRCRVKRSGRLSSEPRVGSRSSKLSSRSLDCVS